MPLDPQLFAEILESKETRKRGGGGRKKAGPDLNDRTYLTWFKLIHKLIDDDTGEMLNCNNENCVDPRDRSLGQTCVNINGQWCFRYCFLDGWLVQDPAQTVMPVE